jgi:SET domain-containing protein
MNIEVPTATSTNLEVRASPIHGNGVFVLDGARAGDVIERCPVIFIPAEERSAIDDTVIGSYYYEWVDGDGAVALGFGSMYNHDDDPNAEFDFDEAGESIVISAVRDIGPGEEVFIRYWPEAEVDPGWFDSADAASES